MNSETRQKSWFNRIGCMVSSRIADLSATPGAQVIVILVCVGWFLGGWNTNILTAMLSILAITLTQMVLNQQQEREIDAHRRDMAMHAKLDELIAASRHARNDLVGLEDRDEEEIVQLKEEVKEKLDDAIHDEETHRVAKLAVDAAVAQLQAEDGDAKLADAALAEPKPGT